MSEISNEQIEQNFAELNPVVIGLICEVRNTWQVYRDRRPDDYGQIVAD